MRQLLIVVMILTFSLPVLAQGPRGGNGGGGRGGAGGGNLPSNSDIQVNIPSAEDIQATASAVVNELKADASTLNEMWENLEIPDDWSQLTIPSDLPTSDDLQAMWDDLPYDFEFDALDFNFASSAEASTAIVGFAATYLGANVSPLYASVVDGSQSTTSQASIDTIMRQFPAELQAMLASVDDLSGVTYWGLLPDGVASVYTGECNAEQCDISQDNIQLQVTSGSVGAYAVYRDGNPPTVEDITYLLYATYPALYGVGLSPVESDTGTAFVSVAMNPDTAKLSVYYAGVIPAGDQAIVYAVVGVGDVFVQLMLQ